MGGSPRFAAAEALADQAADQFPAGDGHRARRDDRVVPFRRDVVVVAVESALRNAHRGRERMQLVVRLVARQVRPQPSVPGGVRRVDEDHPPSLPHRSPHRLDPPPAGGTRVDAMTDDNTVPETITAYLAAHQARDVPAAISHYTADATVVDEGNAYRGPEEIAAWLSSAASEYTYTIELTGTEKLDEDHYVATHHLEGDFPGGVADLHFRFTLRDGKIAALTIEP